LVAGTLIALTFKADSILASTRTMLGWWLLKQQGEPSMSNVLSRTVVLAAALANVVVLELQVRADDKPPAQESRLEQFRGRSSTTREMREGEKVRHSQLVLEFRGGELTFYTEEGGKKGNQFTLKVIGVEQGKDVPYLVLGHGESKYVVYYDFQSERMILVGRLLNRPFEGFSLSGEYKRVEEPK